MTMQKRKQKPVGAPKAKSKRRKKQSDVYQAEDSDPDEEKHSNRYDVGATFGRMRRPEGRGIV
jgi:hypothetical protein